MDDDDMIEQQVDKSSISNEIDHEVGDQYLDNEINTNTWQHGEGQVVQHINNYTPN